MKILFKIMVNLFVYIFVLAGTGLAQDSGRTYIPIWPPKAVYPIAVVEFKNLDGKPDVNNISKQMAEIISNDLDFTGLFKILDPASFLENPQRSGITEQDIDFQSWSVHRRPIFSKRRIQPNREIKSSLRPDSSMSTRPAFVLVVVI